MLRKKGLCHNKEIWHAFNSGAACYSEGSLFRRHTFRILGGSLNRKCVNTNICSVIPKVRYSENEIRFVNPKMK